jgi:cardiolipin hydrolase
MRELEEALRLTFEDQRLSKSEKYDFRDLLETYKDDGDALSFVRNKAFDMAAVEFRKLSAFDGGTYKWLEHIVKLIDGVRAVDRADFASEVYFSPGKACKNRIISLLDAARSTVDVCVFTISDDDISGALFAAHARRVRVRIITDNDKANDRGSDVETLLDKGVAVVKDRTSNHMHNKFALIDQAYVVNGSFNWTRSASKYNNENITVVSTPTMIASFSRKFEELWRTFGGAH